MRRTSRSHRPFFRAGLALLATTLLGAVPVVTPRLPGAAALTPVPPRAPGYWLVGGDGSVYAFGSAGALGSLRGTRLARPVTGMAPTPSGNGYWLVASDGGIFSFGDAAFHGSTGAMKLNKPIVGMAATPTGKGYWFVASDGGIFSFGDAAFFGSTGAMKLNKPIVGMAATPTGKGYWFVAADGGIFNFGDARFEGSAGGQALPAGIVVMAGTRGAAPATTTPTAPTGPAPTTTGPTTVTTGPAPTGQAFQIGLVGDTGYQSEHQAVFDSVVAHMNSFPLAFAVHDGDIKDPFSPPCTDAVYERALATFNRSAVPFIYTPGDNEWMNCPDAAKKPEHPKDPNAQLAKIRQMFFSSNQSLGATTMTLERQAGYPENARWTREGVVFATINAPGPNDNVTDAAESNARRPANLAWLNAAFDQAEATNAAGVMIIWQANPWDYFWNASWKYLTDGLRERTVAFGKPVVLVHGDTHIHRIDKGGKDGVVSSNWPELPNFTRVETYASGPPAGGAGPLQPEKWIRATVDPDDPKVFSFATETVSAP